MTEDYPVRVTVSGTEAGGEKITLSTTGALRDTPGGWMLQYKETSPEDLSSILTLIQHEADRVTVTRTGTLLSTLVFDEQETFVGDYPTLIGNFQIRVFASEVRVRRRGHMGHIHLVYQVNLSTAFTTDESMSTRTLDIRFSPCRT